MVMREFKSVTLLNMILLYKKIQLNFDPIYKCVFYTTKLCKVCISVILFHSVFLDIFYGNHILSF